MSGEKKRGEVCGVVLFIYITNEYLGGLSQLHRVSNYPVSVKSTEIPTNPNLIQRTFSIRDKDFIILKNSCDIVHIGRYLFKFLGSYVYGIVQKYIHDEKAPREK